MDEKNQSGAMEHQISNVENEKRGATHVTETNAASVALGMFGYLQQPLLFLQCQRSPSNMPQPPPSRRKSPPSAQNQSFSSAASSPSRTSSPRSMVSTPPSWAPSTP
jgi:hypothetical protein